MEFQQKKLKPLKACTTCTYCTNTPHIKNHIEIKVPIQMKNLLSNYMN